MLSLEAESWIWYGIVMLIVVLRFIARAWQFRSLKKLQVEDGVMAFVAVCYTLLIVYLNKVSVLPTNLIPPDQLDTLEPSSIPQRIYGSKLVIVVEQLWCASIWGCKACLLLLYYNLTMGLNRSKTVKAVAVYVAFGYMVMEVLFFATWCRPFYNYWSVPAANAECATYHDHLIVNLVFNVSSDLLIMCIPLPILAKTNLPLRKKLILCAVFSFGIFVIICAILSKYYSFHLPYGADWVYWYVREVSTAVIVTNIPHLWVLVRRLLNLRSFLHNSTRSRSQGAGTGNTLEGRSAALSNNVQGHRSWYGLKETTPSTTLSRTESEERITGGDHAAVPLQIWQDIRFGVDETSSNGVTGKDTRTV